MGLLTSLLSEVVGAEFAKKRQDKAAEIEAYTTLLRQPNLKPDMEPVLWQKLAKVSGAKDLIPVFQKVVAQHKQQAGPVSRHNQAEGGDASGGAAPAGGAPSGNSMFFSPEEAQAFQDTAQAHKDALDIQKQVQLQDAIHTSERTAKKLEYQDTITDVLQIQGRGDIDEDTKQLLIQQRTGVNPAGGTWSAGSLVLANRSPLPVLKRGSDFYTLDKKKITPPAGAAFKTQEDLDREKKEADEAAVKKQAEADKEKKAAGPPPGAATNLTWANDVLAHPEKHTPAEVQSAKDIKTDERLKEQGAAVRITVANQGQPTAVTPTASWQPSRPGERNEQFYQQVQSKNPRVAGTMRALADYTIEYPRGAAASREPWASAISMMHDYDPSWSEINYDQRRSMKLEYSNTGGNHTGGKIASLNKVTHHLVTFEKAVDALQAHDTQAVNRFLNFLSSQTGNPKVTNLETAKTAIAEELSTALKQTGATDPTIAAWERNFSSASSPEQFKGSIKEAFSLMAGQLRSYKDEYQEAVGKVDVPIVHQTNKGVFQAHGIDPETLDEQGGRQQGPQGVGGYQIGHKYGGMTYQGGDPNQKASWK